MPDQIQTFIEFLLDTETTSELLFSQAISEKNKLYQKRYFSSFEKAIKAKFQQWQDYYQKEHDIANRLAIDAENELVEDESESELGEEEDEDEENDVDGKPSQMTANQKEKTPQSTKRKDIFIDPVGQCKRLLQFVYYCQRYHVDLAELYYLTLDYCNKNDNEKISAMGLQQIALHLLDDDKDSKRLVKYVPSNFSSRNIPDSHKSILSTIQTLLATNQNQTTILSVHDLDILYPCKARFLDLRREFRDSTQYFIDGDSLILFVAHHINIDLLTYHGNTLHAVFIIERILLTLYHQTQQCNYTLVFFDCHYQCYQNDQGILGLIRSCLIRHLSKNTYQYGPIKVKQFSSWLDDEYQSFAAEEKPHFIFYHDMSSLDIRKNALLSENSLKKLLYIYRLYGNYHQYHIKCHLYLMNILILRNMIIRAFEMTFSQQGSMKAFAKIIANVRNNVNDTNIEEDDWKEFEDLCYELDQNDVRLFVYLRTLVRLKEQELFKHLTTLLILHVALLIRLSLVDRHLPRNLPSIEFSSMISELMVQFQQSLAFNLSSYTSTLLSYDKIADLYDGRLFVFTLYQLSQSSSRTHFDSNTIDIVQKCFTLLNLPYSDGVFHDTVEELIQSKHVVISSSSSTDQLAMVKKQTVTKIANPFVDTVLKPILSTNSELIFDFVKPDVSQLSIYEGKYHWHVYKEVGNEISRIRNNDEQYRNTAKYRYRTKNQQKFYTYFTLYGNSLTSRDVKDNQLQIILPTSANNDEETKSKNTSASGDKRKPKNEEKSTKVHQTKAEKIIEQNKQRKMEKSAEDEHDQITNIEDSLKQIPIDNYSNAIEIIDQALSKFKTSSNRFQLLKKKFRYQRKYLQLFKNKNLLTTEEQSKLELLQVNYFATISEMAHYENILDPFNDKKKYLEELVNKSPLDHEQWYRFQLETINSRLPRREQGIPDSRVLDFIPDSWQVEFLNAVDKQQSIIIVAPTASGKTYASYYAMNKVLKDKDDPHSVCVYIAPTKALVNQVAATIHSKFGPVFGIFTRDYRQNTDNCRILVTVPQCMQILLLSHSHQRWCQRIKYAIFDEIHCMSGEQGSDVWEKTMLLINCPMIGLSATVNNGEQLCQWLQHVEKQRSVLFKMSKPRRVCFIVHHERMADLNKYLYSNRQLHSIHPVGVMTGKQLISRGLPKDFSLSPCETLQLNGAMQQEIPNNDGDNQQVPTLTEYFSPDWIIERTKFNNYSQLVSNRFKHLISQKNTSTIDSIAASLTPIKSKDIEYPERKPRPELIIDFILTLKEKNLLPCIVFSDSRGLCEDMATTVAEYFERLENNLRGEKYKKRIEELKKRVELSEQTRKKSKSNTKKKSSNKRNNDADGIVEVSTMEEEENDSMLLSGFEQQLLDGILDEGTLANRQGCDRELVDALLERAAWANPTLVKYMKRGVAYHHSGVNNKGRVAVEALFRNRYVQVVFSTATLALGIHMPTKTVAFVKDSIYLDALQYRQSSGRAGRRGFDIQGHVIFIDIPLSKIRHLIISAIPNIHAHFPTSVTFLMRLLHLCSNAKDKSDAINRSLIALECPLMAHVSMKQHFVDIQTRFHSLFTLDFLYRLNLINGSGELIGLAGLSTHLHYFEPANILLTYLMATRLFHTIKDPVEIMTIFAYLFTNMPWLLTHQQCENLTEYRKESKYNSKLFLPPIDKQFRERVETYNNIVKEVYGCYIQNVTQYLRTIDTTHQQQQNLPFSNISFSQDSSEYDNGSFEYYLHHHQSQQIQNPSISPFSGLSGLTHQEFMSNYNPTIGSWDLVYDLNLSPEVVPYVDVDCRDHTNATYYLNSYALDFFRHGSEKLLIMENEINAGDTYSLLLDFKLILASIKTSVEVIVEDEGKNQTNTDDISFFSKLFHTLSKVQNVFSRNFQRQYPSVNRL